MNAVRLLTMSMLIAPMLCVASPAMAEPADSASTPAVADPSTARARSLLVATAREWFPGDRIRVLSPGPYESRTAAWFASLEGDSALRVWVSKQEPSVSIRLHQIGALEEKVGTKRQWKTGLLAGLVVGTVAGLAIASSSHEEEFEIPGIATVRTRGLPQTYFAIAVASGTVLGGMIGYFVKTDRFEVVASFD